MVADGLQLYSLFSSFYLKLHRKLPLSAYTEKSICLRFKMRDFEKNDTTENR